MGLLTLAKMVILEEPVPGHITDNLNLVQDIEGLQARDRRRTHQRSSIARIVTLINEKKNAL